jgi:transposase
LEEKVKQSDIARRLEVSLSSIARLAKNFKKNPAIIPSRKVGSGRMKKYSKSLIKFMKIEINQNPMMTSKEMKVKNKKKLGKLSERTIRRILLEDLKLPSYIAIKKPLLTKSMKRKRVKFAEKYVTWSKKTVEKMSVY